MKNVCIVCGYYLIVGCGAMIYMGGGKAMKAFCKNKANMVKRHIPCIKKANVAVNNDTVEVGNVEIYKEQLRYAIKA